MSEARDHGGTKGMAESTRRETRPRGRALPKTEATPGLTCELCGGPVLDRHCKVVCLNCGFQRDCSDP